MFGLVSLRTPAGGGVGQQQATPVQIPTDLTTIETACLNQLFRKQSTLWQSAVCE